MQPMTRSRWAAPLTIAIALHASALFMARRLSAPESVAVSPSDGHVPSSWLEIDVIDHDDEGSERHVEGGQSSGFDHQGRKGSREERSDGVSTGAVPPVARNSPIQQLNESTDDQSTIDDTSDTGEHPPSTIRARPFPLKDVGRDQRPALERAGIGQSSPWLLPDQTTPSVTEQQQSRLDKSLLEGTLQRDYQRSVGIDGPIRTALTNAAYRDAPTTSIAHLSVYIDQHGRVAAIDVIDVDRDMAKWSRVAKAALAQLASVPLRVPEGQRLELVFELQSKVVLPSGSKPKSGVSLLGVPLGRKDEKSEPLVKILNPRLDIEMAKVPNPGNPNEDVELPVLDMGISVLEFTPELVDIGAQERQVVHAKLMSQRVL